MFAMAVQADVLGEYSFEGSLGDKIPVRLKFAVNGEPKRRQYHWNDVVQDRGGRKRENLYLRRYLDESENREIAADEELHNER